MLVSVALFATVMTIALGALLAISQSDLKAESLKTVINNLNFALDDMSRSIRTGSNYHCGAGGTLSVPQDCSGQGGTQDGASYLAFTASDGSLVEYQLDTNLCANGQGCIERQVTPAGGTPSGFLPITSPDVVVTGLTFYVIGSPPGDGLQPKVTILLHGFSPKVTGAESQFNLQTSITQRIYDQ